MKKTIIRILAVVLACVTLAACGPKTLESIMSSKAAQAELDKSKQQILDQFSAYYCDYDIEIDGNNITYKYYYSPDFDEDVLDQVRINLENDNSWSNTITSSKDQMEKQAGIRPETITFIYYSSTGDEIFRYTE